VPAKLPAEEPELYVKMKKMLKNLMFEKKGTNEFGI